MLNNSEKGKKVKKSITIPLPSGSVVVPIMVVLLVVAAFFIGSLWTKVQTFEEGGPVTTGVLSDVGSDPQAGEVDPVTQKDHVKGDRNARIALIEYSDLECPFCKSFHPTAQKVVDEYDDVMWVYRHFPLDQIHSKARKQAEAVECAGKLAGNDGFWALIDKIFAVTPSNNGLDMETLPDLASEVGIDKQAFQTCLDSGEMTAHIEADYQSGVKAGVTGTPGNILLDTETGETRLIPGAVPYPQIKQAIDAMLSN